MLLGDNVKDLDKELKDKLGELNDILEEIARETGRDIEDLYEEIIEWIRSRDPVSNQYM